MSVMFLLSAYLAWTASSFIENRSGTILLTIEDAKEKADDIVSGVKERLNEKEHGDNGAAYDTDNNEQAVDTHDSNDDSLYRMMARDTRVKGGYVIEYRDAVFPKDFDKNAESSYADYAYDEIAIENLQVGETYTVTLVPKRGTEYGKAGYVTFVADRPDVRLGVSVCYDATITDEQIVVSETLTTGYYSENTDSSLSTDT